MYRLCFVATCALAAIAPLASVQGQPAPPSRVAYAAPDKSLHFQAKTDLAVLGGAFGAAASMSGGDEIIAKNNIEDPARAIATEVAKSWATSHNAALADSLTLIGEHQTINQAVDPASARYVAMAITTSWGFQHLLLEGGHYGVFYTAMVGVRDNSINKLVVSAPCSVTATSADQEPPLANGAAGLKALLASAGRECLEQVRTKQSDLR